MKPGIRKLAIAAGLALAASFAGPAARAAEPFTLHSPALEDGGTLATKFSANASPGCSGDNLSPPLAWTNPPGGTKSFALTLVDLDGGAGLGFVHLVVYGIPASVTAIAEGDLSQPSDKFVGGTSGRNLPTYFGPCPPPGSWHHYVFTLIATDFDPKGLPVGLTRDALVAALKGHAKGGAVLTGKFRHP